MVNKLHVVQFNINRREESRYRASKLQTPYALESQPKKRDSAILYKEFVNMQHARLAHCLVKPGYAG